MSSGFLTIRDTNKQLSSGVVPSSLDTGFIPSADKMSECLKQRNSPNLTAEQQAENLIEEIKTSSKSTPVEKRGQSLYVVDDYDSDAYSDNDYRVHDNDYRVHDNNSDHDIRTTTSLPSRKHKSKSKGKFSKLKEALKSKLS